MERDFTIEELKAMLAEKEKEEAEKRRVIAEERKKKLEEEKKRRENELQEVFDNLMEHEQIFKELRDKFVEDYHYCNISYKGNNSTNPYTFAYNFINELFGGK